MSDSISTARHIGILGGTFDPIHTGHLLIAEVAREHLGLDQVRFIPAAQAPHKLDRVPTTARHRWEMVRLAISGNPHFYADERELHRGGTSFTVDTLAELHAELRDSRLYFLMGTDSLNDFHNWRDPGRICQLASVSILARGGMPPPDLQQLRPFLPDATTAEQLAQHQVPLPQVEISSTELRARVAAGRSIRYQVPAAVAAYIDAQQLYRASED